MPEAEQMSIVAPNQLLIDGEWVDGAGGEVIPIIDPADGKRVDEVAAASATDVEAALAAAQAGFETWRAVGPWERSRILRQAASLISERCEQIARVMTQEQGKRLVEARDEVRATAEQFDWYADETRRIYGRVIEGREQHLRGRVLRQPIGPVAAFSAWNFPALLPARKMAAALAAGCSVIVKPADEAPRTALCLAQALQDAGLPDGVLGVLMGDPVAIGEQLLASPIIRKVSLTGSVPVGQTVLRSAAADVKHVTMELGGHAPVLLFADADLPAAVDALVAAKFRNSGQVCASPSRFFVEEKAFDEVLERVVAAVGRLRLGPGTDAATDVGPLSNHRRVTAMGELVDDAVDHGADVLIGGREPEDGNGGFFFEPTVVARGTDAMRVMREEPFGPIAPFSPFSDLDEVIERANDSMLGLAGYVFTRDLAVAHTAAERLDVGLVGVNHFAVAVAEAPFGGVKHSGFGREGGTEGIDDYTVAKYINTKLS